MGWEALQCDSSRRTASRSALFHLLRHAALRAYLDTGIDFLAAKGLAQPQERIEAELVGLQARADPQPGNYSGVNSPAGKPSGPFSMAREDPTVPAFAAFWNGFGQITRMSAVELDAAAREMLDLASYRLDAWITSRCAFPPGADSRGEAVGRSGARGVRVAGECTSHTANGALFRIRSRAFAQSGGNGGDPPLRISGEPGRAQRPLEIDLSSKRVRLALHLLDGMREGQSLGALLGYRFERSLHESKADQFIAPIRRLYPLEAGSGKEEVVDGLTLLRNFRADPRFWQVSGTSGLSQGLGAATDEIASALDAVADLAVAESVHQMANGNLLRAGAVLDAIARGDTPPPEIEVVKTPRSGTALTYRLMTAAIRVDAPGWTVTPRGRRPNHD